MALRELETLVALDPPLHYDGSQLRPHFLRERCGLRHDAAAAFRGPCDVRGNALVDLADRESDLFIHSRDMVHVFVEVFGAGLTWMILLQRLLASCVADEVRAGIGDAASSVLRRGDDVYVGDGKLTVSIATVSPVSGLIHLGVNVDGRGAPVRAAGLESLGIETEAFANGVLGRLKAEVAGVAEAQCKVTPAHGGDVSV